MSLQWQQYTVTAVTTINCVTALTTKCCVTAATKKMCSRAAATTITVLLQRHEKNSDCLSVVTWKNCAAAVTHTCSKNNYLCNSSDNKKLCVCSNKKQCYCSCINFWRLQQQKTVLTYCSYNKNVLLSVATTKNCATAATTVTPPEARLHQQLQRDWLVLLV